VSQVPSPEPSSGLLEAQARHLTHCTGYQL
jgi:hypothetical protein